MLFFLFLPFDLWKFNVFRSDRTVEMFSEECDCFAPNCDLKPSSHSPSGSRFCWFSFHCPFFFRTRKRKDSLKISLILGFVCFVSIQALVDAFCETNYPVSFDSICILFDFLSISVLVSVQTLEDSTSHSGSFFSDSIFNSLFLFYFSSRIQ